MRIAWIALIGIAVTVAYGIAVHAFAGDWNFSLAFGLGAVVALAISGFRSIPAEAWEIEEEPAKATPAGESVERSVNAHEIPAPAGDEARVPKKDGDKSSTVWLPEESADSMWARARAMEAELDPEMPVEECVNYMELLFAAAEEGHVGALARLGELAFNRSALVEAYFWTKLAYRHQELLDPSSAEELKEIDNMLRIIRRRWSVAGQPPEYENVYGNFPEERGELGRAFLRLDTGIEIEQTCEYLQMLAQRGNPDAALFEACRLEG